MDKAAAAGEMATHRKIMENLSIDNPALITHLNDALAVKYSWGDYAHPIEILAGLRQHMSRAYGLQWTNWDPDVLVHFVIKQFGEISDLTAQKVMAILVALTTDAPWTQFDTFENTCLVFSNNIPLWGIIEPMDTFEMAFGMGVLDAIRTDEYSDDVLGYIAATLLRNGVIAVPDSLPIPDVNFILRRQIPDDVRPFADQCIHEWESGNRVFEDYENPLDVQLARFFEIEESFTKGSSYEPKS